MRPLDVGKMRRSYGLILGHRVSLHAAGVLPNSLSPIMARRGRRWSRMARPARCAMVKIDQFWKSLSCRHSGARQRVRAKRGPMTGSVRARNP
jgi:hypothetical protein